MMVTVLIKSLNINSLNSADLKVSPGSKVECVAIYALEITGRIYNVCSKYLSKLEHREFLISPRMVLMN